MMAHASSAKWMIGKPPTNKRNIETELTKKKGSSGVNILARYGAKIFRVETSMPWEITVKIPGLYDKQELRYSPLNIW